MSTKERVQEELKALKDRSANLINFLAANPNHYQYELLYDQLKVIGQYITILKLRLAAWHD